MVIFRAKKLFRLLVICTVFSTNQSDVLAKPELSSDAPPQLKALLAKIPKQGSIGRDSDGRKILEELYAVPSAEKYLVPYAIDLLGDEWSGELPFEILSHYSDTALPLALDALEKGKSANPQRLIAYLQLSPDSRAVPVLAGLLKSGDSEILTSAILALGNIPDARVVMPLIALLKDDQSSIRVQAVRALSNCRDRRAIPPILELLRKDKDQDVRMSAVYSLGKLEATEAADDVQRLFESLDFKTQGGAAGYAILDAVGRLRDVRAVPKLCDLLEDRSLASSYRKQAAKALGRMNVPAAEETLYKVWRKEIGVNINDAEPVRDDCALALAHTTSQFAVEAAEFLLNEMTCYDNIDYKLEAVEILKDCPFENANRILAKVAKAEVKHDADVPLIAAAKAALEKRKFMKLRPGC